MLYIEMNVNLWAILQYSFNWWSIEDVAFKCLVRVDDSILILMLCWSKQSHEDCNFQVKYWMHYITKNVNTLSDQDVAFKCIVGLDYPGLMEWEFMLIYRQIIENCNFQLNFWMMFERSVLKKMLINNSNIVLIDTNWSCF